MYNDPKSNEGVRDEVSLAEQIRISKRELETVFDAISEFICILDNSYRIIRVNRSYSSFVKKPIREILGKPCFKVFWDREEVCENCPSRQTFSTGETVLRKRVVWKGPEEIRYFETSTYPVFGEAGKIIRVIEHTRDITEEKRVFEQLVHSEKLASIGVMTAGIAHEMNNPLSGISGTAVNLLQMPEKYGLNDRGISRISTILESAAHATTIMKDLLHLSRKHDSTRTRVDINALIVKATNTIHLQGISEIQLRFNLDDSITEVECDPSKIEQVIVNIVTNAFQSIQEKENRCKQDEKEFEGVLQISTVRDEGNVVITVSDNGTGIPEENRVRLFDPFFSTRQAGQGTGLGLSICLKIIEEHEGKIFFDIINGKTVFSIELPVGHGTIKKSGDI